jgi:hypothetical protein
MKLNEMQEQTLIAQLIKQLMSKNIKVHLDFVWHNIDGYNFTQQYAGEVTSVYGNQICASYTDRDGHRNFETFLFPPDADEIFTLRKRPDGNYWVQGI